MLNCYKSILSEVEASAFSELIKGEGEAMGRGEEVEVKVEIPEFFFQRHDTVKFIN